VVGTAISRRTWLAPASSDAIPEQIYWMFYGGTLDRVDLRAGTRTAVYDAPVRNVDANGALSFVDADLFVVQDTVSAVLRVNGSGATEEHPVANADTFSGLLNVPGIGMVACSSRGALYLRAPSGSWRPIGDTGLALGVCTLALYKEGFVFGGDQGFFGSYTTETGVCPATPLLQTTVTAIFVIGDALVVASHLGFGSNPTLTWLDERR
jgi:hypothetical protein